MTHHFVITSSLLIKILKIDKFGDFSCDIDLALWQTYLEKLSPIYLINGDHPRPKGAYGGHSVRQPRCASKRSAFVYIYIYVMGKLQIWWNLKFPQGKFKLEFPLGGISI